MMTKDELALHARNTLGYSERMTQDLVDAYRLGAQAMRERCIAAVLAADDCGCGVPCDCYSVGTATYAIKALGDE